VLVTVTDSVSGAVICDATVTIASGTGAQHFTACPYAGGQGPDPFSVTVEKAGYTHSTLAVLPTLRPMKTSVRSKPR
jgi:hypothetical protein